MQRTKIWDPVVRLLHWSLAAAFTANALITDPEGAAHLWIGYSMAVMIAARIGWGLIGPNYARFSSFRPSASLAIAQMTDIATRRRQIHPGHSPLGRLMVYNLLAALIMIVVSGWMLTTPAFWGTAWIEDLHEAIVVWAEVSIVIHIGSVFFEARRTGVKLPRSMVTGYKNLP